MTPPPPLPGLPAFSLPASLPLACCPCVQAALFNQHALGTWCADGKSCASPSLTAMPENLQALLASGCAAGAWVQYARDGTEYAYKKDKGWYVNGKATNMTAAAAGRGPCSDIPDTLSTLSSFA